MKWLDGFVEGLKALTWKDWVVGIADQLFRTVCVAFLVFAFRIHYDIGEYQEQCQEMLDAQYIKQNPFGESVDVSNGTFKFRSASEVFVAGEHPRLYACKQACGEAPKCLNSSPSG